MNFERRRHRLLLFLALSALATALIAVGLLGFGLYHFRHQLLQGQETVEEEEDNSTKSAALPVDDDDDDDNGDDDAPRTDNVLPHTTVRSFGETELVDVGVSDAALKDMLAVQQRIATAKGQTLVVWLGGRGCKPCQSVYASLHDPLMQEALKSVRLVRIDMEVFREEIRQLHLPTNLYPAFFLLDESQSAIDAIHGGEWDEDIAENIAPVLGAFVRGELDERRHYDWSPTTTGIAI